LIFGLVLAAASTALMAVFTNWLATALTVAAIAYYDVVYTLWLKRTTPHNTFWGGVCGAAPVLIGWAAVTGSVAAPAWVMFGVVFFWQMPHFYALALAYRDDYARAGIPMLPVVASARRVGLEAVGYAWLTVLTSVALWPLGMTWLYVVPAVAVGALFLVEAHGLYARARRADDRARNERGEGEARQISRADDRARNERGEGEARQISRADDRARNERGEGEARQIGRDEALRPMRLFHWSTTYLTVVFVAIAVDALIRQ
jgi:protoheme IX farnesyltransferase